MGDRKSKVVMDLFPVNTPRIRPNAAIAFMNLIRAVFMKKVLDTQNRAPKDWLRSVRGSFPEISEEYIFFKDIPGGVRAPPELVFIDSGKPVHGGF